MVQELREGEVAVDMPAPSDAGLVFIGRIRTPWTSRLETPRQGRTDGPICRLEIFEPFVPAIKGVDFYSNLEVLYWLDKSRRDIILQSPKNNEKTRGAFSLRSPVRPNPIGTSIVKFVGIEGNAILVRGLDYVLDLRTGGVQCLVLVSWHVLSQPSRCGRCESGPFPSPPRASRLRAAGIPFRSQEFYPQIAQMTQIRDPRPATLFGFLICVICAICG